MKNRSLTHLVLTGMSAIVLIGLTNGSGCRNPCAGTLGNQVVVAVTDSTPPAAGLVATRANQPNVSVSDNSPEASITVGLNDLVSFLASASDDQGPKEIQIWREETLWRQNQVIGPGLLATPHKQFAVNATAGDKVCTPILLTDELRISSLQSPGITAVRVRIWAEAINFSGQTKSTARLTINWP